MRECKRGDERIMRVTEIDGERVSWVCEGELVRCEGCVNWGSPPTGAEYAGCGT